MMISENVITHNEFVTKLSSSLCGANPGLLESLFGNGITLLTDIGIMILILLPEKSADGNGPEKEDVALAQTYISLLNVPRLFMSCRTGIRINRNRDFQACQ